MHDDELHSDAEAFFYFLLIPSLCYGKLVLPVRWFADIFIRVDFSLLF